jgi:hypothetical protein
MTPSTQLGSGPQARALGALLAALAPLLAMLSTASAYGAPSGNREGLLSAALELHPCAPPGYPLALLLGRLCALLPLGPLPLRVALASILASSFAAAALYRALDARLHAHGLSRALVASPLALGITLFAFGQPLLFCAEPRAYAVALALGCLCLERLTALHTARSLRTAGLLWALLCVEQPAFALLLALGSMPALLPLLRDRRLSARELLPIALGLPLWSSYALRAQRADAFAGAARAPLGWLGSWAQPATLLPLGLCAAAVLGSGLLAVALRGRKQSSLAVTLSLLSIALGVSQLRATSLRELDRSTSDTLRQSLLSQPPARSTVLVDRDLALDLRDAQSEQHLRPDLDLTLKPWLLDLSAGARQVAAQPSLRPLLRTHLLQSELPVAELRALAATRPLLLELDPALEHTGYRVLLPHGLYHQVAASPVSKGDRQSAAAEAEQRWQHLQTALELESVDSASRELLVTRLRASLDYYGAYSERLDAQHVQARLDALGPAEASQARAEP